MSYPYTIHLVLTMNSDQLRSSLSAQDDESFMVQQAYCFYCELTYRQKVRPRSNRWIFLHSFLFRVVRYAQWVFDHSKFRMDSVDTVADSGQHGGGNEAREFPWTRSICHISSTCTLHPGDANLHGVWECCSTWRTACRTGTWSVCHLCVLACDGLGWHEPCSYWNTVYTWIDSF